MLRVLVGNGCLRIRGKELVWKILGGVVRFKWGRRRILVLRISVWKILIKDGRGRFCGEENFFVNDPG